MEKEPIYRVKVEVIGKEQEGHEISETLRGGVECNGFTIIADNCDGCTTVFHHVTTMDVAKAMASSGTLMAAATIAKAVREAKKYEHEDNLAEMLKGIMNH